ncbi:uncharacterized protein PSFLO_05836 [Pseudozyma flocculosa]|uniref:U4/U6 snRNA-associated-splicing factor PRP24 n=1 Tax=Pseudozyma flocculosa TaxID=84751 RepID=A0A5C3F7A3_9BASI|nr:uncharacterized protein PSFLO_05836 [Pseudozyma flocculosa]
MDLADSDTAMDDVHAQAAVSADMVVDHSTQQRQSDLDPAARRETLRSLQQALLKRTNSTAESSQLLAQLVDTYQRTATDLALLPQEWKTYLAALLHAHAEAGLDPAGLESILEEHARSCDTLIDTGLVRLYISLLLHYFGATSSIVVPTSAKRDGEDEDDDDAERGAEDKGRDSIEPLAAWTGVTGGPSIDAATSTYVPSSLPRLRTESSEAALQSILSVEAVRSAIRAAYTRCAYHIDESQLVWQLYLAFEQALLDSNHGDAAAQTETIKQAYLARLRVPHVCIDDTFQSYSRFVTNHLPAESYETELLAANKVFASSKKVLAEREQYEDSLAALRAYQKTAGVSRPDPATFATYWKPYLLWQQKAAARAARGKDKALAQTEQSLASGLYERAISQYGTYPPSPESDLQQWETEPPTAAWLAKQTEWQKKVRKTDKEQQRAEAEQRFYERTSIAEGLWQDYVSTLEQHLSAKPDVILVLKTCERSTHVLPGSASVFTTYMRQLSRFKRPKNLIEDVFARIMSYPGITEKGAGLVDLLIARIDCEREAAARELAATSAEAGPDVDPASSMDKFMEVYALISYGLSETGKLASAEQDGALRLERYAVDWVERAVAALGGPDSEAGAGLNELAETVWQNAVKAQGENVRVYREAAAYWIRRHDARKARGWFKGCVNKFERSLSSRAGQDTAGYEQLLDEWLQFEHQRGRIEDVDYAVSKAKAERERIWQLWYASYATEQGPEQPQQQHQHQQVAADAADEAVAVGALVDASTDSIAGVKRKAEDAVGGATGSKNSNADPINNDGGATDPATTAALNADPTPAAPAATATAAADESQKKAKTHDEPTRDRENSSVLVAGLPADVAPGAIRAFLRDCGEIVSITGPRQLTDASSGEATAAALVEFRDRAGAASAQTRNMKRLHDAVASVHLGWQCTLFVTNFPESWDDEAVRRTFGPYGTIFDVRWPSRKFVSTRRFVYVQFTLPTSAAAALELDGRRLDEKCTLNVALSDPSRRKVRSDADANARELFVSGLPRFVAESEVRAHFEPFGRVEAARLPSAVDGKGGGKGVAFLDFASPLDATRAMKELNGSKLRGKVIAVTLAKNRGMHGTVHSNPPAPAPAAGSSSASSQTGTPAPGGGAAAAAAPTNRAARRGVEAEQRRLRSVRLGGIPSTAQEALIQQSVEKAMGGGGGGSVRRVFWTEGDESGVATVEFHDVAVAGRAALRTSFPYGEGVQMRVLPDGAAASTTKAAVPPSAGDAGGGGEGAERVEAFVPHGGAPTSAPAQEGTMSVSATDDMDVDGTPSLSSGPAAAAKPKGQDDFRKMLQG